MKMTYIIIGLILVGGLIFYLTAGNHKSKVNNSTIANSKSSHIQVHQAQESTFIELRNMAFSATPSQLELPILTDQTVVFGVVMDWEMDGGIATTVAYQTGDASLYLSSGGGVIGGGQHESVSNAAKRFVSLAQTFLNKATKTETTPLPTTNEINFYLLTNNGIYVGQDVINNFENNSSDWLQLFEEGNKVLAQLRQTTPE